MPQVKEQFGNSHEPVKPSLEEDIETSLQMEEVASVSLAMKCGPVPEDVDHHSLHTSEASIKMSLPESTKTSFLELVFEAKGREKKVQLFRRPLGAEFKKLSSGPTKVSKVHAKSYAGELGLQVGWAVKSVGGEDVSKKAFQQVQDAIKSGLITLA